MTQNEWIHKVGNVFHTYPRIGNIKDTVWLERKGAYDRLHFAFQTLGAHVCLDGPSGTGKTSLALTYLSNEKIPHVAVQITSKMTWIDFCREIMIKPVNVENSIDSTIEFGIDKGLPTAKYRIGLGTKNRESDDLDLLQKKASSWSEHDVARALMADNAAMMIDDLERANEELLIRLADLCKLLTQTYVSPYVKLLFVGTGDIFSKLYKANSALDERLIETSLGSFKSDKHSWRFLTLGFEQLKLRHPGNSIIQKEYILRDKCVQAIYEAADGLPKSLNKLGQYVARRAYERTGVSAHDIIDEADKMAHEHWLHYSQQYPQVLEYLLKSPISVLIIRSLYKSGIACIHRLADIRKNTIEIAKQQNVTISYSEIDKCIDEFVKLDFIIHTGKSNDIIFVTHPTSAHTLGVVMRDQTRFPSIEELLKAGTQLVLGFPPPDDDGESFDSVNYEDV